MPRLKDHYWGCPCAPRAGASASVLATRVGEMIASSVTGPTLLAAAQAAPDSARACPPRPGPAGYPGHSWHHRVVQRGLVLFSVGVVLALVLNLLQVQRSVTLFPDEALATVFSSAWWVPPCCGTAAGECPAGCPAVHSTAGPCARGGGSGGRGELPTRAGRWTLGAGTAAVSLSLTRTAGDSAEGSGQLSVQAVAPDWWRGTGELQGRSAIGCWRERAGSAGPKNKPSRGRGRRSHSGSGSSWLVPGSRARGALAPPVPLWVQGFLILRPGLSELSAQFWGVGGTPFSAQVRV